MAAPITLSTTVEAPPEAVYDALTLPSGLSSFWTGTSVHSHAGWEIVLIVSGELRYVLDGERAAATCGRFLELPAGSIHAIWGPGEAVFDVIGQQGLGLTIVVPDGGGAMRQVPVYLPDGPWAQEPPAGASYTPADELERLRRAGLALR